MAFQAAASFLVGELIGIETIVALGITASGLAAITSVVAFGLAYATSRIIAGSGNRGGAGGGAQDQGVRVQLPPATYNKVPVIYGRAFQQGILTDARINETLNTMTYVLTLSEMTTTGTYTLNDIYWNDQRLLFANDGCTVTATQKIETISIGGITTSTSTISTAFNGLIRCYTYAGFGGVGSSSTQLYANLSNYLTPTRIDAYQLFDGCNVTSTGSWQMNDLVFGIIQLNYSSANGVTALPSITYDISNSLYNPGEVWYDYMTNARYGAGFTATSVNSTTSIGSTSTSLKSISYQIPPNQFDANGNPIGQFRYEINGVLNTGETVKTNLDKINMASSSWTTYDHKLGEWRVVPNRPVNTATDTIFAFNDNNIIGDISITSTNLEDLYNQLEVAYPNNQLRDQIDYYRDAINPEELNQLEPPNEMVMRTDLCNNNVHAGRIGLMELYQSRADKVVTLTADYSALQVEVGDVISLTNTIYGFVNKLFRVSRVRETEGEDGSLAAEITGIEYDPAVYVDYTLYQNADRPTSNIPNNNTPAVPNVPIIYISIPEPTGPGSLQPYFIYEVFIPGNQYGYTGMELFYSVDDSVYNYLTQFYSSNFNPGPGGSYAYATVTSLGAGTYYFRARSVVQGNHSELGPTSSPLVWNPVFGNNIYDFGQ
jgi:hypothetical protein